MTRLSRVLAIATVALTAGACVRDRVEITIEPKPDGSFVRSLRLWRADDGKPKEIKAPSDKFVKVAKPHYMEPLDTPDATVAFRNTFYKVPQDMGLEGKRNAGGYTVTAGTFGRLGHYRERRPGRTDIASAQREIASAIDTVTTLLAAMARQQLEGEAGVDRLAAAIEGDFRRDLQDLAAYLAATAATGQPVILDDNVQEDKAARDRFFAMLSYTIQFAEERGYVKARDLPRLADSDFSQDIALRLVAKHMGRPLDAGLRTKLLTLTEGERWEAAGKQALQAMGLTEDQLKEKMKPLVALVAVKMFDTEPLLHYVLVLPEGAELVSSNGQFDEKSRKVEWTDELDGRLVAQLFHVLWATPDAEAQRKRFGRVAVQGMALMKLTVWEASLAPERRTRWNAAVGLLDPKGDLKTQLKAIRIDEGEDAGQPNGVDLLLKPLGLDEEKGADGAAVEE